MAHAADRTDLVAKPGLDPAFVRKLFYWFLALAALSLAISIAGKQLGRSMALGGHTESTEMRRVVLSGHVLAVPDNAIRFEPSRRDGVAQRLDLYLLWPEMEGYSSANRQAFNNADGSERVIFLSFEPQIMSRDMSGRLDLIYRRLIEDKPFSRTGDMALHRFKPGSGYANEVLALSEPMRGERFVARCLEGSVAAASLSPCSRDIVVADGLTLSYRFSDKLLPHWSRLDAAVWAAAKAYLAGGPAKALMRGN